MTKFYSLVAFLVINFAFSQVGIGTDNPTETLDVVGTARIRHIDQLPGDLTAARDSIVVFNNDGVLKFVSSNMIVSTADADAFPNNEKFTSGTVNPVPIGDEHVGDTYQNTTDNSWWYFDGTNWLEMIADKNLAQILANGNFANGLNITDLADPVNAQDAATKNYVDTEVGIVQDALDAHITADQDLDPTNEIQDLSLAGNILTITNNGTATDIDLSQYLDNTDDQQIQTFALVGNTLTLTLEDGGTQSVDLAGYVSTDDQNIMGSAFDSTSDELTIGIENGTSETLDLSSLNDTAAIDAVQADVDQNEADADAAIAAVQSDVDQNEADADAAIATVQDNLDAHVAADQDLDPTNEIQDLSLAGNILTITNNGTATQVDLSQYLDNTDDQQIQTFTLVGNTLTLTLEDGGTQSVDLAGYVSTDDQNIMGSAFNSTSDELTIGIENGTSETLDLSSLNDTAAIAAVQADVDQNEADADTAIAAVQADVDQNEADADAAIATVQDNLDAHVAADQDLDPTNEIQDLSLAGNILTITNNGTATDVDLSQYLDNTDDQQIQTFALVGNTLTLTLEDGGTQSVDLAGYVSTDDQNIMGSAFDSTNDELTIGIENGTSETLDLSSLNDTAAIAAVQADVDQNEADVDAAIAAVQADVDQNEADADAAIATVQDNLDAHVAADQDLDPTNEIQDLSLAGNILTITNNGTATDIDLSQYLDNTDDQQIQTFALVGNTLTLTLEDGGTQSVDLAGYVSTDDQNISGSTFDSTTDALTIGIENGTSETLDLSSLNDTAAIQTVQDNLDAHELADQDLDPTNEIQDISSNGSAGNISLSDGSTLTLNVDDADSDPTNEIQDLSLAGNILTITNNGTATDVDLSQYLDNTDDQQIQTFALVGNTLTLTLEDGGTQSVDLAGYVSTDDQNISGSTFDSTTDALTIGIENGTSETLDLSSLNDTAAIDAVQADVDQNEADADAAIATVQDNLDAHELADQDLDPTNEIQDISSNGSAGNISLSDGSTLTLNVDDADADPTNEIQDLSLAGNILTITNNGTATDVDLSQYLDNTDDQQIQTFALVGNTLTLTLEDGGTQSVDLAGYVSTDDQNISGSAFDSTTDALTIGIENGTSETLDLSSLNDTAAIDAVQADVDQNEADADAAIQTVQDNLDAHELADQDLDPTNEIQDLSLAGNILTITNNGTATDVDLSQYLDNTDDQQIQTFALVGNTLTLTLEDGGTQSVDLAGYVSTDDQNISGSTFDSTTDALTIGIENGTSETLDLSSLNDTAAIQTVQDNLDAHELADQDLDPTNEIQDISSNGSAGNISLSDGSTLMLNVDDADADPTNEIQTFTSADGSVTLTASGNDYDLSVAAADGSETIVQGAGISVVSGTGTSTDPYIVTSTEVDGSVTNELQTLSISGSNLSLSNGGGTIPLPTADGSETIVQGAGISVVSGTGTSTDPYIVTSTEVDGSVTNELQDISSNGNPGSISISDGSTITLNVDDADADPTNEIQNIYTDGSPGNIEIAGGSLLTLNVNDADSSPTNEIQDLSLSGNVLTITNNAGASSIYLNPYLDNTDDQQIQTFSLSGNILTLTLEDGGTKTVDLSAFNNSAAIANVQADLAAHEAADQDLDPTNEIQDISSNGAAGNITLSDGSTLNLNVNDADADPTNEIQTFTSADGSVTLTASGNDYDLSVAAADGSETVVQGAGISAVSGTGTSTDPYVVTSTEVDGSVTNELQTLSIIGNNLSLSNGGGTIPLPTADGSETKINGAGINTVTGSGTAASPYVITATEVDGSITNELQEISTDGTAGNISISSGSTIALNVNDADADPTNEIQTLSISGNDISLSDNGGTITLPNNEVWYATTTTAPATSLTEDIYHMAKVGINTTTPGYDLEVQGRAYVSNHTYLTATTDGTKNLVYIGNPDGGNSPSYYPITLFGGPQSGWNSSFFGVDSPNGELNLYPFSGQGKFDHFKVTFDPASTAANTARMTVNGNLGVGDTNPNVRLDVKSPDIIVSQIYSTNSANTASMQFINPGGNGYVGSYGSGMYISGTGINNTNHFFVQNNGDIGIGTNAPLSKIDALDGDRTGTHNNANAKYYFTGGFGKISDGAEFVHSNGTAGIGIGWNGIYSTGSNGNNNFLIRSQAGGIIYLQPDNASVSYQAGSSAFYPSNSGIQNLGLNGNRWNAVYTVNGVIQTSDLRLKKNIRNSNYGLADVMKMRPVIYDWKDNSGNDKVGFIAQELKEIVPNVVIGDESKEKLGVNYAELVPVLTKAIQEQENIIEEQAKELSIQKEENAKQQNEIDELRKAVQEMQEKIKSL